MKNLSVSVKDENGNNIAPNLNKTSTEHFSACVHILIDLLNDRIPKEYGLVDIESYSYGVDPNTQTAFANVEVIRKYLPIEFFFKKLFEDSEIEENFVKWNNSTVLAQYEKVADLDGATSEEEELFIKLLQTIHIPGVACVTIHPFSLLELAAESVFQYKDCFFKQLPQLPTDIIDNFPELETNYINVFKLTMIDVINEFEHSLTRHLKKVESQKLAMDELIKIKHDGNEIKIFVDKMKKAIESEKSYDNIHHELSNFKKQNFHLCFSVVVEFFIEIVIDVLKDYHIQKEEYRNYMGQTLNG